jgi:hypothetical protein
MPATDPATIQSMCAAMAGNDPGFKKLRIEDATLDSEGWDGICKALSSSTAVTLVSLHRLILPSTALADLARAIIARPTRVSLELFRVPVDMTSAEELANILTGSPRIESVSLFEVGLGDDGAAVMAKMIEGTEDLSQFCLMDASVGEPGQNGKASIHCFPRTFHSLSLSLSLSLSHSLSLSLSTPSPSLIFTSHCYITHCNCCCTPCRKV